MNQIHLWCDFIAGDIERFSEVQGQKKLGETPQTKMGGRGEIYARAPRRRGRLDIGIEHGGY